MVLFTNQLSAQSDCKDYVGTCNGFGSPYKYSGQSKSATMEKGQTSSFKLVTYSNYEYSVSLCSEKQLKGIYFKIYEDTPQKTLLYDGQSENDGMNWKQFFIEKSKMLIVEVTIPPSDKPVEEQEYDDTFGCVAVVIEYYKSSKRGFDK